MDLGSVFLRFTEGRAMSRGADAYGAAQALRDLGHFGPAARFYDVANEAFVYAQNPTAFQAAHARDQCLQRARERGEDPGVAFEMPWEQVVHAPQGFVAWYYERQGAALNARLDRATQAGDWNAVLAIAECGSGVLQYLSGRERAMSEHNLWYYAGLAHLQLGHWDAAADAFAQAYHNAQQTRYDYPTEMLAWDAYYLGASLKECAPSRRQRQRPTPYLEEALRRFRGEPQTEENQMAIARTYLMLAETYSLPEQRLDAAKGAYEVFFEMNSGDGVYTAAQKAHRLGMDYGGRNLAKHRSFAATAAAWLTEAAQNVSTRPGVSNAVVPVARMAVEVCQRLGAYDAVVESAQRALALPEVQDEPAETSFFQAVVQDARARLEIEQAMAAATNYEGEGNFTQVHQLLSRAEARAAELRDAELQSRVQARLREVAFRDPGRVEEHARVVHDRLAGGEFREAELYYATLHGAQPDNAAVARIGEEMDRAKRRCIDEQLARANRAICEENPGEAEEAIERARNVAGDDHFDSIRRAEFDLAHLKVELLARQAQAAAGQEDFATAAERLHEALRLENLDDADRTRLVQLEKHFFEQRDQASAEYRSQLDRLLDAGSYEEARPILERAERLGHQDSLRTQRQRVDQFFHRKRVLDEAKEDLAKGLLSKPREAAKALLQDETAAALHESARALLGEIDAAEAQIEISEARKTLGTVKELIAAQRYDKALEKLDEVLASDRVACTHAEARTLKESIQPAIQVVLKHYCRDNSLAAVVAGHAVGFAVFLVAWLGAEMPFLVAAFLDLGGCYCVASAVQGCRSMSCLTHNGRWHLTALSVGGGLLVFVTFLLVWLGVNGWLSSLVGTVVGGAGLVLVEQLLKPLCPALRIDADGEAKGG